MGAVVGIARRWVAQDYRQPADDVIATAAQFCRVAMPALPRARPIKS
jgi:hypothetical protein